MNKVLKKDIDQFASTFGLSFELKDSTFLITGATGLIGSTLIHCLIELKQNIRIIALVRNLKKAKAVLDINADKVEIIECELIDFDYNQLTGIDYIIHCAAPTSSKFFIEKPVETFNIILDSTSVLLKYAHMKTVKSFVYLSSLEVYGEVPNGEDGVTEEQQGYWNPTTIRSSYPIAKRASENLCCLYANEYNVPVKIARLTQTTGAGISKEDNRVIAQFARLAVNNEDIVLHTTGESARPYCYTTDCIAAILYILLKGRNGEAYNVANEETYISAREMAEFVRDRINPKVNIRMELNDNQVYAPISKLRLSTKKLSAIGWKPQYGLFEIFSKLIEYLNELR